MSDKLKMYICFASFIAFTGSIFLIQEGSVLFYLFGSMGILFFFVMTFFFVKLKLSGLLYFLESLIERIKGI